MGNILQQLNRHNQPQPTNNQILNQIASNAKSLGPSEALFNSMYNSNSQFREFADSVKGMTPEQACSQNGLNFNMFKPFRW